MQTEYKSLATLIQFCKVYKLLLVCPLLEKDVMLNKVLMLLDYMIFQNSQIPTSG